MFYRKSLIPFPFAPRLHRRDLRGLGLEPRRLQVLGRGLRSVERRQVGGRQVRVLAAAFRLEPSLL